MQADQGHEDVARMRAVIGLEEVGILPVENSLLNARSRNVVVERRLRLARKRRVRLPMP